MKSAKLKKIGSLFSPFIGLIFLIVFFAITTNGVTMSLGNFKLIINQSFSLMLVTSGVFLVMTLGMMDLSCGQIVCFCCYVVARVCQINIFLGIIVALLSGAALGALNGFTTATLKMPSFLATLCLNYIITGIMTQLIASSAVTVPSALYVLDEFWYKFPLVLGLLAVVYYLFRHTKLGHYMRFIGSNEKASFFSGVSVAKVKYSAYIISGLLCAVAAILVGVRSGTAALTTGSDMMFNAMIALVLGGFPNGGGTRSRFAAPVVGSIMICVLNNGLTVLGVSSTTQSFIKGGLFMAIVIIMADNVGSALISNIRKLFHKHTEQIKDSAS